MGSAHQGARGGFLSPPHCDRTPLTGEVVHVYATAAGERLVCELCRPLRRQAPARSELMHAPEHERSVRLMRRAA